MKSCTAVASASTSNLGPGYDVFGLALSPLRDRVTISRGTGKSGLIKIKMMGAEGGRIPSEIEFNSAGRVVEKMARAFGIHDDLTLEVTKGVPTGSGMGSSGASAAAAAVAFNKLYDLRIRKIDLIEYAVEGEIASAGAKHYDNVSPSLLGGFVIVRITPPVGFIQIDPPKDLVLVVALPSVEVPAKKTAVARSVLPKQVPLENVVHNVSNASTIVAGFLRKDVEMIARGINDLIVEPARKHLIPGYDVVKEKALHAGALAVTISGAGPSLISFLKTDRRKQRVAEAMAAGFREVNLESRTFTCRPGGGARVVG